MKPRRIALVSLFAVTALALTACGNPVPHSSTTSSSSASPSHHSSPTPSATPTPTTAPLVVGSVQFSHDDLTVVSTTSKPMAHFPWNDDPATVVSQLNGYFGTPATTASNPAGNCSNAISTANWGGQALRLYWNTDPSQQDGTRKFFAQSRASSVGPVTIEMYQGFKVGDSSITYLASVPNTTTPNGYGQLWTDLDADGWGIEVDYDNHVINLIASPAYVHEDC